MEICSTVDCIHYPITEPRPFSKSNCSHKLNAAGLSYEFVIFTHKDKLVSINGPFIAGTGDKDIFKNKMKGAVEKKQKERKNCFKIVADSGYIENELQSTLSCRNELDDENVAYFKDRALSRHESFNRLTKVYRIMTSKFHHDRGLNPNCEHPCHQACLVGICVTIQCELDLKISSLLNPYPE